VLPTNKTTKLSASTKIKLKTHIKLPNFCQPESTGPGIIMKVEKSKAHHHFSTKKQPLLPFKIP
jgi:hypothetical protein